jgi:NADH pyrophosphatase NudC (nudix superfamily)
MTDETANQLRAWAASGLTRNLFSGATPLCDTLAQAADHIEALQAQLAERDRALAEWAEVSQRNYQRAKEAEERLAEARAEVDRLRGELASINGACDSTKGEHVIMTQGKYKFCIHCGETMTAGKIKAAEDFVRARATLAKIGGSE